MHRIFNLMGIAAAGVGIGIFLGQLTQYALPMAWAMLGIGAMILVLGSLRQTP